MSKKMTREDAEQLLNCAPEDTPEKVKRKYELAMAGILAKEDTPFYNKEAKKKELETAFLMICPEGAWNTSQEDWGRYPNEEVRQERERDIIRTENWFGGSGNWIKKHRKPVLIGVLMLLVTVLLYAFSEQIIHWVWPPTKSPELQKVLEEIPAQTASEESIKIEKNLPDTAVTSEILRALNDHVDNFLARLNGFTVTVKSKEEKEEGLSAFEHLFDSSAQSHDSIIQVTNAKTQETYFYSIKMYASTLINNPNYRGSKFSKQSVEILEMVKENDYEKYKINAKVGQVYKGRINDDLTEKIFFFNVYRNDQDEWVVKILKIRVDKVYDLNKKPELKQ